MTQRFMIAPWNVQHSCDACEDGWVCENHPEKKWPSECECGAGAPCPGLLEDVELFQAEADAALDGALE